MCYNALDERFQTPEVKSNRVQRLKGMTYEAQGDWGRANLVYEEMLKKDPTNMARLPPGGRGRARSLRSLQSPMPPLPLASVALRAIQGGGPDPGARLAPLRGSRCHPLMDAGLSLPWPRQVARKRKVCVLKAQGNTAAAIDELNTYLEDYGTDGTAWSELAELYIQALRCAVVPRIPHARSGHSAHGAAQNEITKANHKTR